MNENNSAETTNETKQAGKKGLLKWGILVAVVALILIGTPYAIQFGIKKALTGAGAKSVQLEDVDFNPFTGELVIKNLQAQTGEQPELIMPRLALQIDWLPLFSKQIYVHRFELEGMNLSVRQTTEKQVFVAGILLPVSQQKQTDEPASEPWGFGLGELKLANNEVTVETPEFKSHSDLADLNLQQFLSWNPDAHSPLTFQTKVNGAPIAGELKLKLFEKTPVVQGHLKVEKLDLSDFEEFAGEEIQTLKAKLSTDIQFKLQLGEQGLAYEQDGAIQLSDVSIQTDAIQVSEPALNYAGRITFSETGNQTGIDGQFKSTLLHLSLKDPRLDIDLNDYQLTGQFSYRVQTDQPELTATGAFQTGNLAIKSGKQPLEILNLAGLSMPDIQVKALDQIQLSQVEVHQLRFAHAIDPKQGGLLSSEKLTLTNLQYGPEQAVAIESIQLQNNQSRLDFDQKGQLALVEQLKQSLSSSDVESEKTSPKDAPQTTPQAPIKIGSIQLTKPTRIDIQAKTDGDPIRKQINLKLAEIGPLDNQRPDDKTPIVIDSIIDKHATLTTKGFIKPFSDQTNLDLKTVVKALDLQDFSPLIKRQIGYNIMSGQLNADSQLAISNDQIKGDNTLTINQLQVASAQTKATENLNQQLSMPLDSALDLLRDDAGDIQLKVPLSGDINSPDFDLGDVINQAIGGALKGTTTSFLKLALQPYGLIFMAAEKALEASAAISLEPIVFEPGQSEVNGKAPDYLEKIGQLMQKRPGIRLRLCGIATEVDRAALSTASKDKKDKDTAPVDNEPLLQIATARADAVRLQLIEKHQISVERLFTCLPQIDPKAEGKPRVDMLI